jgi:hypothetical protein
MARQAGGVVASHSNLCEQLGLTRLEVGLQLPDLPVYLACHWDVQHNRRIRVLMDFLADQLPNIC